MDIKQSTAYCLLLAILFSIFTVLSGCGNPKLVSDWRDHEIVIDGKYTDWGNTELYYDEKEKVVINLLNDRDYLYICLISRSMEMEAQLMESGFVAWFDPDGGRKKVFGVHFPIGLRSMGMSLGENERKFDADWRDQEDKAGLIDREKERLRDKDFQKRLEALEGLQEKLELLMGPFNVKGRDRRYSLPSGEAGKQHLIKDKEGSRGGFSKDKPIELSLEEAGKLGIEAKVGRENGYFVYELKVPLVKSALHPYAIQVKTSSPIGLGLEIPWGIKMMDEGGDHKPEREGRGGPAPIGMGHGMYPGEVFQLWTTVTLTGAEK